MNDDPGNHDIFSLETWDNFLNKNPCNKDSLLTGIALGSIMTIHRRRINIATSSFYGLAAFGFTTLTSSAICAYSHNDNVRKAQAEIAKQQQLQREAQYSAPANLNRRANPNIQELKSNWNSNPTKITKERN